MSSAGDRAGNRATVGIARPTDLDPRTREGRNNAALPRVGYGVSVLSKMSVRFARLPSFAIAKNETNEFPARANPS